MFLITRKSNLRISTLLSLLFTFTISHAQLPVFNLADYANRVQQKNDTLYVVNFWATWCKPCVAELPYFQKAAEAFAEKPVKIILASQDAKSRLSNVADFLKKHSYTSECFILSAGNPNIWIDKIEQQWSGTIPATMLYKNGNKIYFHEGDYEDYEVLEKIIHSKL
ncbi:MAG: TlpA disulfide reductase family protein [Chitinophagales bacterium]